MNKRSHVNKHRSANQFRKNMGKTKSINIQAGPMRGGWRL